MNKIKLIEMEKVSADELKVTVTPHAIVLSREDNIIYEVFDFFNRTEVVPLWAGDVRDKQGKVVVDAKFIFEEIKKKIKEVE